MVIFHSYVSLPEGNAFPFSSIQWAQIQGGWYQWFCDSTPTWWRVPMNPMVPEFVGKICWLGPYIWGSNWCEINISYAKSQIMSNFFFLLIFLDQSKFLNHTSWFGFLPIFPRHSIHSRGPALRSDTSPWSKLRAKAMQAPLGMGCGFDGIIYHKS